MKVYDLDDLRKFGVTHIGSETCGLGMRSHYGLTQEAWEHWAHFTGQVQLLENARQFLTTRYYSTIVVPHAWMEEFLIYLVLQAGHPRVIVHPRLDNGRYVECLQVLAEDVGGDDDAFTGAWNRVCQNGGGYIIQPYETAEKDHGFRNRHYWTGEIE